MKKCNRCGVEKELTDYYKNKTGADGYKCRCIQCDKELHAASVVESKAANKEKKRLKLAALHAELKLRTSKRCCMCEAEKPVAEFHKHGKSQDGYQPKCKTCASEYQAKNAGRVNEIARESYERNKEDRLVAAQLWRSENPERVREINEEWRSRNPEKIKAYKQENRERFRARDNASSLRRYKERYATDREYNLTCKLRKHLRRVVSKGDKRQSALLLVGCDREVLIAHLEKQFTEGMTWQRLMGSEIHLDHIIPLCAYDMENMENQKMCFHYSNIRPLWAKDNLTKAKRDKEFGRKMDDFRARKRGELFDVGVTHSF